MANFQICQPNTNFIDSRRSNPEEDLEDTFLENYPQTASISSLKTALSTFDSTTYTDEVLETMNVNDLMYAWRLISGNEVSVSDYQVAQEPQ